MKKFLAALQAWGLPGVFLIGLIDGAGVPNPGGPDWILLLYSQQRPDQWWLAALMAVCGSVIGTMVLYEAARKGGEKFLDEKLKSASGQKFRRWFHHYGLITVFIPAVVPIPMPLKAFVLCSGAVAVPRPAFIATMIAARLPRYLALCWLGRNLHDDPVKFLKGHALDFLWIGLALAAFCVVLVMLADHFHKHPEQHA